MILFSIGIVFRIQGYRIITARMEWMAFQDAFHSHIAALQRPVLLDRFYAVIAACRIEPA